VKELGGDEEDFQLLLSLESKQKDKEQQKDKEEKEASFTDKDQQELKNLIKSLNLSKFASLSVVTDAAEEKEKEKKVEKAEKKGKEKQKKLQDSEVSSTTSTAVVDAAAVAADAASSIEEEPTRSGPEFHFVKTTPNRGHCVIRQSESKWYSSATEPAAAKTDTTVGEVEVNLKYWLPKIEKYTQLAWDLEIKNYEEARKKGLYT